MCLFLKIVEKYFAYMFDMSIYASWTCNLVWNICSILIFVSV